MDSQKERIRQWLTQGPICATTLLANYIPRGAARIAELRSEGLPIVTRPCTNPSHMHDSRQIEYVIEAGQGRLL